MSILRVLREKINKIKIVISDLKIKENIIIIDFYTIVQLSIYTTLAIIFFNQIPKSLNLILTNIFIIFSILTIVVLSGKLNDNKWFMVFRRIYVIPLVLFLFDQVQNYIKVINPADYDDILIKWDYALFGVNPTEWIYQFANPIFTEILQISYASYFIMPIILGLELHFKNNDSFNKFAGYLIFSYYISYILYFIMPAIGPRFVLHDFGSINIELPGLFLTEYIRFIINSGENIPIDILKGISDLNPAFFVNRDCMPSGHTLVTTINMICAFKFKSKFRWIFLIFTILLIISTVYLRYHYVVDIIAGLLLVVLIFLFEPYIRQALNKSGFKSIIK
ncbi:MAG: phosphatase PAP2 family protein [Candidatus Kapabacteria bacterium]|nr:phosphatase PAP2 family protein [Candidatus Kapabacteria bacterium]